MLYQTSTAGDQARRPATTLSPPRPRREGGATLSLRVVLLGTLGRGPLFEEPPPLRHRDDRHLLRGRTRAASALAVRVGRHRQHVRAEQADDEHRGGGGVHGVLGHIPRAEQDGDDEPVEQHAEDGHGRRALRVVQFAWGEMRGDVWRCVGRRVGRCGEMWGRGGERWGEVGRGGEMWGDVGEMWGEVRVIQLAGPHERDGRPVQPEQALKGGEGEQQRLNEERAPPSRHPPHWWKDGQASSSASYELETTGTSRQSAEPANTPPRQLSSGTYGGIWGDLGRCGEMWEDLGKIWGDVGRSGGREAR